MISQSTLNQLSRRKWLRDAALTATGVVVLLSFLTGCNDHVEPGGTRQTRFIPVGNSLKVEVLDWGGKGKALLLLTGLGNTAHVFQDFAPRFTDQFHVYAMTRRGFGQSSHPATGYDVTTLARDILIVINSLQIDKVILVGHSIGGEEISKFASSYPNRVEKVVYLDAALDRIGWPAIQKQSPPAPEPTANDLSSPENSYKFSVEVSNLKFPYEEFLQQYVFSPDGRYLRQVAPEFVEDSILNGLEHPAYGRIQCPALAIYARHLSVKGLIPYYDRLDASDKKKADAYFGVIQAYYEQEVNRFKTQVAQGQAKLINGAHHYVFLSHPTETVSMIRDFLR